MRTLPSDRVTTRAEALEQGWSDSALHRAVAAGRLHRVRRGRFVAATRDLEQQVSAIAAHMSCGGSAVSHLSAAIMHGLPVLHPPGRPTLTVRPRMTGDMANAHLHRATLAPDDLVVLGNVLVTSVARTLIDVARSSPPAASVVPLDAALHRRVVTPDELDYVLQSCANWPGIKRARRAVRLADGRSESPLESVSRLALRWLRLPEPELQVSLCHDDGVLIGRADFYWDEFGVVGEADGEMKYDSRTALVAEKCRQELLEDQGLIAVRWGWGDVVRRPRTLRDRVERAFARGKARDAASLSRNWSVRVA